LVRTAAICAIATAFLAGLAGCVQEAEKAKPPIYERMDKRDVSAFMAGTIHEITNLQNDQPFLVSGWGLVVNLDGTGGSRQVPNNVKAFMVKEMERKGFGSKLTPQYQNISPEQILNDNNAAVVAVYGWIPPGSRKGQWFDIALKAEGLEVTSLARGLLYDSELTIDGANPANPFRRVNVWANAYGPVFVNPAVALNVSQNPDGAAKRSLRSGVVIGGGQVIADRPLLLRIRGPEKRIARAIEARVNEAFHQDKVCTAYDEAYCQLWVPERYNGDWEHFAKLVQHLYLQGGSESFARTKARELVAVAKRPNAPLQDISYCWEGLGNYALPELAPLLADGPEDVRFAAARAAAYIGDPSGAAERALYNIAAARQSPFQLAAVQVLGRIPNSRAVNQLLRDLLDSEQMTVRIEAYNILARAGDASVQSRVIGSANESANQKFVLDFVHCAGQPLIYATRSGVPRIAIFGSVPELSIPLTFAALDNRLMISSGAIGRDVTIFYRDGQLKRPVQMSCPPDVADVVARLAGQMDDGTGQLDFTYAEILAILQGMSDQHKLQVVTPTGEQMAAAFMLQDAPNVRDAIDNAPLLDKGRPQGDNNSPKLDVPPAGAGSPAERVGQAADPNGVSGAVNSAATIERQ
jgi:flagellar basal body P-ring protein FlgI